MEKVKKKERHGFARRVKKLGKRLSWRPKPKEIDEEVLSNSTNPLSNEDTDFLDKSLLVGDVQETASEAGAEISFEDLSSSQEPALARPILGDFVVDVSEVPDQSSTPPRRVMVLFDHGDGSLMPCEDSSNSQQWSANLSQLAVAPMRTPSLPMEAEEAAPPMALMGAAEGETTSLADSLSSGASDASNEEPVATKELLGDVQPVNEQEKDLYGGVDKKTYFQKEGLKVAQEGLTAAYLLKEPSYLKDDSVFGEDRMQPAKLERREDSASSDKHDDGSLDRIMSEVNDKQDDFKLSRVVSEDLSLARLRSHQNGEAEDGDLGLISLDGHRSHSLSTLEDSDGADDDDDDSVASDTSLQLLLKAVGTGEICC